MSNHAYARVVGQALKHTGQMAPVGEGKSAIIAFVIGVCFGAFGVGIYLKSWADFFILLGLLVLGSIMTVGLGAPVFWVLSGVWGAVRVMQANQKKPPSGGALAPAGPFPDAPDLAPLAAARQGVRVLPA